MLQFDWYWGRETDIAEVFYVLGDRSTSFAHLYLGKRNNNARRAYVVTNKGVRVFRSESDARYFISEIVRLAEESRERRAS